MFHIQHVTEDGFNSAHTWDIHEVTADRGPVSTATHTMGGGMHTAAWVRTEAISVEADRILLNARVEADQCFTNACITEQHSERFLVSTVLWKLNWLEKQMHRGCQICIAIKMATVCICSSKSTNILQKLSNLVTCQRLVQMLHLK